MADSDLEAIKKIAGLKDSKKMTADNQLDRLLGKVWRNPFDVLQLHMGASDEEIKKQYKLFTIVLHPDKCSDPRASDAFTIVDMSYKTLLDGDKRKMYQKIMNEAKEKTDFEREKENKKRKKLGQPLLPEDSYENQYQANCRQIFDEIEEKKSHYVKLEQGAQRRRQEEIELLTLKEQYKILTQDEWEKSQDERISKWHKFNANRGRIGAKGTTGAIRHPSMRPEERPTEFTESTAATSMKSGQADELFKKRK